MVAIIFLLALVSVDRAEADQMKQLFEKATFAAGCFWGVEKVFSEQNGVISTQVGYAGGQTRDPDYERVCTGATGHAEAVEITYDPAKVSYDELLEVFFRHHDPTTPNRQGPDIGSQYRSAVFYHNAEQEKAAQKAVDLLERAKIFRNRIVTEIKPAGTFYRAEEYHQKYLKKNPHGYCSLQLQSEKIGQVLRADDYEEGNKYYREKNYEKAIQSYRRALQSAPGNPTVKRSLDWARSGALDEKGLEASRRGDWDEAVNDFEDASRLNPGQKDIERHLDDALREKAKRAGELEAQERRLKEQIEREKR